ncbi:accessory Sec system glycosylation chaperone GtfB [Staphylococcus chromogenes]|uniref:accessory Sec system glycosylation chaperone GtfB n=1 Tax=Staphylococcus chromogenes TaxID=46126 RepID=UPI0028836FB5|nr:accessory Sec system glycosylation chaperone GtfB [Staphylococcus chromogenes]MDT0715994.1 accessory Sec system glycosylation chaperone GtfB [Staphylococcus chromogenes]MDT0736066.1 accessory Sec system glycosylation chaperone GtfB [Staphylococcus chromogenes]MDT0750205.1 accessory Sec system glycosylation chaperone GtfB [Staphylococcus chromogenes]
MINLFERFDLNARTLYDTLRLSKQATTTLVIEDDGFLPEDIVTPYRFFANMEIAPHAKPLYFNEVPIPRFWEIEGNNEVAWVKDMGMTRAKINYRQDQKPRVVSHVDWYDAQGRLQFVDHYTEQGVHFAQSVYDLEGTLILRKYLDQQGKEVIYENFVVRSIILNWKGKTYHFQHKVSFILFFIKALNLTDHCFIINSLGLPYAVLYNLETPGHDLLFWQEQSGGNVPGNMQLMLQGKSTRQFDVVVPDANEYQALTASMTEPERQHVHQAGYLYDYQKKNGYTMNILIMTNSDQIHHLPSIIEACPFATFHIGAVTEMSSNLTVLDQYSNVKLFPAIEIETVNKLYQLCDVYLDINEGGEIINAVRRAFYHQLLILAYEEIAHNRTVTAPENCFTKADGAQALKEALKDIQQKKRFFKVRETYQQQHVNQTDIKTFNALMSQLTV